MLSACDANATDSCTALSAACLEMTGQGSSGACVPSCFANGPFGCQDPVLTCSPKTASKWRTGACAGGTPSCDVLDSAATCGIAETCEILGGIGFGGLSLYCSAQTGTASKGEPCGLNTPPYCSPGLTCYGGTCATYCTPGDASSCDAGAICADISLSFSMAPGEFGVCQTPE